MLGAEFCYGLKTMSLLSFSRRNPLKNNPTMIFCLNFIIIAMIRCISTTNMIRQIFRPASVYQKHGDSHRAIYSHVTPDK